MEKGIYTALVTPFKSSGEVDAEKTEFFIERQIKGGVKGVVLPAGGHAVYINMDEFFDGKRGHETFAGEGFSLELIRRYGIRVSELGDYSMEYDLLRPPWGSCAAAGGGSAASSGLTKSNFT